MRFVFTARCGSEDHEIELLPDGKSVVVLLRTGQLLFFTTDGQGGK